MYMFIEFMQTRYFFTNVISVVV